MQKAKKIFLFLAIGIFSALFVPSAVAYADSPAPPSYFYSYITNMDSHVKYTDILVKISKSSKYYTDLNASNANAYGFNRSTSIVAYNQNGYMSISFHCKNVRSTPSSFQAELGMCGDIELDDVNNPISSITDSIKIALLDKDGNVLKVSDAASVMPIDKHTFPRTVRWDARSAAPTIEFLPYYHGYSGKALPLLIILAFLIRMAISTAIEALIAVPFKIRPLRKIVAVNIVTQILLFAFIEFGGMGYTNAVIVGEIFVFVIEFVAYIFLFRHISKSKLALYTVIANSASLAVGMIFNYFHVFTG